MKEPILKKKSMLNRFLKKQMVVTTCTVFLLIFILLGSSYALLNAKTETGLTDVVVQSGNLLATVSSSSEMIELNYTTLGVSDEIGLTYDPYTFTVTNDGENKIAYYEIRIVDKEYEISTLPHKALNFVLSKNNSEYTSIQNLGDNKSYIYAGGSLASGESDTFNLKLWVNEEFGQYANNKELKASIELTLYSDIPTRNYIIYDTQGGSYIPKTNVSSKRITSQVPTKEGYVFSGWSSTVDGEVEYESDAVYSASRGTTLYALWEKAPEYLYSKLETTLAANLTEADEDGTRFVYGSDVTNNYVWYSGKLWRVVSLNNDGTIKLVTQNNMTSISFTNGTDSNYSTSQVRSWLNNEFLPTLNTELLADTTWDYTIYSEFPTEKLETIDSVVEKVGSLNIYEYMKTGGTLDFSTSNTFLNNGYEWWLISPKYDTDGTWVVVTGVSGHSVECYYISSPANIGIRPSVNLMTNVIISSGMGEIDDPYMINDDVSIGQSDELLNNRVIGEYINFNNVLYRIVGTETVNEKLLTKVTMADYDVNMNTLTSSLKYGSNASEVYFSPTYGIGKYLDDWYTSTSATDTSQTYSGLYIDETYKKMIATKDEGVVWYQGPDSGGVGSDYSLSKTGTGISATIGLPYYGEMFSSHLGGDSESSISIWLMTKFNSEDVYFLSNFGVTCYQYESTMNYSYGVRPSFYLKSTVRIGDIDGDDNVGNGTKEHPYEILMD